MFPGTYNCYHYWGQEKLSADILGTLSSSRCTVEMDIMQHMWQAVSIRIVLRLSLLGVPLCAEKKF